MDRPVESQHIRRRIAAWLRIVVLIAITAAAVPSSPLRSLSTARAQNLLPICGGVFAARADATISQSQPTANFGSASQIGLLQAGGTQEHSLLQFDLKGAVPPGATIYSAELELALVKVGQPLPYTLQAFNVQPAWDETSVSWNTRPALGQATTPSESRQTSGTLRLDVSSVVIGWLTEPSGPRSLALLPAGPTDVQFSSREGQIAPRLVIRCAPAKQAQPVDQRAQDQQQAAAIERLRNDSRTPLRLDLEAGAIRFAELAIPTPQEVRDSYHRARWFLDEYRAAFRLKQPADELQLIGRSPDQQHLVFRQRHNGIPVFPAELTIHLDGATVSGVSGRYLPDINFDATARLSVEEAQRLALAHSGGVNIFGDTQLRYINLGLLGEADSVTRLAWHVTVSGSGTQRSLFIDANSGTVLYEQTGVHESYDLELKTRGGAGPVDWTCWAPGAQLWFTEGGPVAGGIPPEGFTAFGHINAVYNYWNRTLGRDSFDGRGRKIEMHLNVNMGGNASYAWWCDYIQFDTGWATRDILGHEFAHGIVHHTADLEYRNQSGALNESFADIFAYFVDSADWQIGEDLSRGAFRDISNPPAFSVCNGAMCYIHPDHLRDYRDTRGWDDGGVHINSGIHNKAAYLIIRGDSFSGLSIRGLGQPKAERLFYNVLQNRRLTASAQLIDARNAALAEATSLATSRSFGFTSNDVCQVRNAYAAVGLGGADRDCDGTEDASDTDRDGDSVPNSRDNCADLANSGQSDIDRDGRGDACDTDIDGDGIANGGDNCLLSANTSQADRNGNGRGDACDDPDSDAVVDARDNCPDQRNSDQRDQDFDGRGDACDSDRDGDGVLNTNDNSPDHPNPGQEDGDSDGIGNASDLCPGLSSADNSDPDRDGRGNPCDDDDDNDGVGDSVDNCREVANPQQWDWDNNGIGFACDDQEQELFSRTAREIDILTQLRESEILRFPIPFCLSCPYEVLPENFWMGVDLVIPAGFLGRVVDSNGIAVSETIAGTGAAQQLRFTPVPFAAAGGIDWSSLGGSNATPAAGPDTLAPDEIRYRVEIIPAKGANLTKPYQFKATFAEGRSSSAFLPLATR